MWDPLGNKEAKSLTFRRGSEVSQVFFMVGASGEVGSWGAFMIKNRVLGGFGVYDATITLKKQPNIV